MHEIRKSFLLRKFFSYTVVTLYLHVKAGSECMNTEDRDRGGGRRFLDYTFIGGWDVVGIPPSSDLNIEAYSSWSINSSEFVLEKLVGSPAFFSLYVDVDDKNSSVNVLTVSHALAPIGMCVICNLWIFLWAAFSEWAESTQQTELLWQQNFRTGNYLS